MAQNSSAKITLTRMRHADAPPQTKMPRIRTVRPPLTSDDTDCPAASDSVHRVRPRRESSFQTAHARICRGGQDSVDSAVRPQIPVLLKASQRCQRTCQQIEAVHRDNERPTDEPLCARRVVFRQIVSPARTGSLDPAACPACKHRPAVSLRHVGYPREPAEFRSRLRCRPSSWRGPFGLRSCSSEKYQEVPCPYDSIMLYVWHIYKEGKPGRDFCGQSRMTDDVPSVPPS